MKSPVESLCGPTPCDPGSERGYLTNFRRCMLPKKVSNVVGGNERHSATARRKAPESVDNSAVYLVTRPSTSSLGNYEHMNMKLSQVLKCHKPEKIPQGASRVDRLASIHASPYFQNQIAVLIKLAVAFSKRLNSPIYLS